MNPEAIKEAEQDVALLRGCRASIQQQLGTVRIGQEEVVRERVKFSLKLWICSD